MVAISTFDHLSSSLLFVVVVVVVLVGDESEVVHSNSSVVRSSHARGRRGGVLRFSGANVF